MKYHLERFEAWHMGTLMDPDESLEMIVGPSHAQWLAEDGRAWTLLTSQGDILACGGTILAWPGRCTAWMVFSKQSGPQMLRIVRAVKKHLAGIAGRVEMSVIKDYERGHKWARIIGFEVETPVLHRYGPAGEDHVGYVMFNEAS